MLNFMFCRWARDTRCLVGGDTTGDQISCQSLRLPRCCGVQREHQHLVCNAQLYSIENTLYLCELHVFTPGDLVRRCVSCQHPALQPSWILGICVKDAWTLESTTGVVNKWPRVNPVCMVFHWKLTVDGVMFTRFEEPSPPSCGFCHIPYDELNMPFPTQLTYCYHCRRQKVITIVCLIWLIF